MINFDSSHILIGYLKQLLSTFNLPTCRIYTKEFYDYFEKHGKEDPRVIKSFDTLSNNRLATRINYLKENAVCNYRWSTATKYSSWEKSSPVFYDSSKFIPGLTRTLKSPGNSYDTITHEYLGDYLRFIRDYYNVNLMSMYNCFNNKICNNLYYYYKSTDSKKPSILLDSQDDQYHIYAIPVKLFSVYTIAIDCKQSFEMCCGLYSTRLDDSTRTSDLISKTYQKVNSSIFSQPFLFDKLAEKNWTLDLDAEGLQRLNNTDLITQWDIANREQDLKLFIKLPVSCKSSIVILEGDYRHFNNKLYERIRVKADGTPFNYKDDTQEATDKLTWQYKQNHCALNFEDKKTLNDSFTPISPLQLLAFNLGRSYPFADRLIEYLCGSVITPMDKIADNIKRAQKVMEQNNYYFKVSGLWEPKMQKIIYDYITNAGPISVDSGKLKSRHSGLNPGGYGYHPKLGYTSKSSLYDILGYVDKDAEKWYASWKQENGKVVMRDNIQNIDIYNGLFNI